MHRLLCRVFGRKRLLQSADCLLWSNAGVLLDHRPPRQGELLQPPACCVKELICFLLRHLSEEVVGVVIFLAFPRDAVKDPRKLLLVLLHHLKRLAGVFVESILTPHNSPAIVWHDCALALRLEAQAQADVVALGVLRVHHAREHPKNPVAHSQLLRQGSVRHVARLKLAYKSLARRYVCLLRFRGRQLNVQSHRLLLVQLSCL
mmetsp:Transcript_13490/g.25794  ORF Transcript_13490/g.25794 Transcript_13490/m.25794 type:complete len:204 (+) Transcript_13490:1763-2374(+)